MKAYKIAVPESYILSKKELYDIGNFGSFPKDNVVTRQEIHELIKAHAKKLGYTYPKTNVAYVLLRSDGVFTPSNNKRDYNRWYAEPIEFQDFLKLTPEDVIIKPELTQEEIDILIFKQPTATDHKEKAWELFLIMMGNSDVTNRFDPDEIINTAINKAAEFIKKVGNK